MCHFVKTNYFKVFLERKRYSCGSGAVIVGVEAVLVIPALPGCVCDCTEILWVSWVPVGTMHRNICH